MAGKAFEKKELSIREKIHRGHYIYFLYCKLYEFIMDRKMAGISLDIWICNEKCGLFPVQSVNYRILRKLKKELVLKKDDVFVDVGCGPGRLIDYLRWSGFKIKKYYGIEINEQAFRTAQKIFAGHDDVSILYGDARTINIQEATVYMLFNPFDDKVLLDFLKNIEKSAKPFTRIYYLNAVYNNIFQKRKKWRQIKSIELKPKYHVPVVLCEYIFEE